MPDGTDLVTQWLAASPFVAHAGIKLSSIEPDRAEVVLTFDPSVTTIGDMVHGGAIGTLIDSAATAASWAGDVPDSLRGSTVGMTVTFLAAARASDLTAVARVVRRGKSLVFSEVDVADAAGTAVAKGLVTYKLG